MTQLKEYKKWMRLITEQFSVTETQLLSSDKSLYVCMCRKMFYILCMKDKIDLYRLSRELGKDRTTGIHIIKNNVKINKQILDKLWNGDSQKIE